MTKRTFWMLLLAVLVGLLLEAWSLGQPDICSAHLAGLAGPATQIVRQGRQSVEVPCEQWFRRQPIAAQAVSLAVGVLLLAALLNACLDLIACLRARRAWRQRRPTAR